MIYLVGNGAMQTTAAFASQATGAAIKTLFQIKPLTLMRILAWGISFDASAAATPGKVELISTGTVFGTSATAFVSNDITQVDGEAIQFGDPTSNYISVGTSASGFGPSAEGTITAVRNLDGPQFLAPTGSYYYQMPLGQEPCVKANDCMRIRVTFGAGVNAYAWVKVGF